MRRPTASNSKLMSLSVVREMDRYGGYALIFGLQPFHPRIRHAEVAYIVLVHGVDRLILLTQCQESSSNSLIIMKCVEQEHALFFVRGAHDAGAC